MSAVVAIPARLGSTRFPKKVMADINGKPMLWYVYQGAATAELVSAVWVLSESSEVLDAASSWGAKTILTSESCPSGTDRIASVAEMMEADIIINVQGDEPLIKGLVVDRLVTALQERDADVATPIYAITSRDEIVNPNVVKVARAFDGKALYFSRSPIPYVRDSNTDDWSSQASFWGHVGVYAYRRTVLLEYPTLSEGQLEKAEKLEQLRLLEAGKEILTVEVDYHPHAVDVPQDLERVMQILASVQS